MDKLGVSLTDANGKTKDAVAIISELGERLKDIKDPSERAQLAMGALGVRYRDLIPLVTMLDGTLQENIDKVKESGRVYDEATKQGLHEFGPQVDISSLLRSWKGRVPGERTE